MVGRIAETAPLPILSRHRDSPKAISTEASTALYPAWATCRGVEIFAGLCKRNKLCRRTSFANSPANKPRGASVTVTFAERR